MYPVEDCIGCRSLCLLYLSLLTRCPRHMKTYFIDQKLWDVYVIVVVFIYVVIIVSYIVSHDVDIRWCWFDKLNISLIYISCIAYLINWVLNSVTSFIKFQDDKLILLSDVIISKVHQTRNTIGGSFYHFLMSFVFRENLHNVNSFIQANITENKCQVKAASCPKAHQHWSATVLSPEPWCHAM